MGKEGALGAFVERRGREVVGERVSRGGRGTKRWMSAECCTCEINADRCPIFQRYTNRSRCLGAKYTWYVARSLLGFLFQ